MPGTLLSLFDYSGNWSRPYAEAGHNVVQLDLAFGHDIAQMDCAWLVEHVLEDYGTVDGIMAAPPCTHFARSGAQYWPAKDADGRTAQGVHLVRQVLRAVEFLKPKWWVIENPVGRMNALIPELKPWGPWYFHPCDFGDPYTKKTGLWGKFIHPTPLFVGADLSVEPIHVFRQGSFVQMLGGKSSDEAKRVRSDTPQGFASAFFVCNPL